MHVKDSPKQRAFETQVINNSRFRGSSKRHKQERASVAHTARASAMKVARTKAQLKHLKTKRKKAADKKKRRQNASKLAAVMAAGDTAEDAAAGAGNVGADDATESGRMKKNNITQRKRELREQITDLKSKRSKIAKKNFGKSEERKALTKRIQELERLRGELANGGEFIEAPDEEVLDSDERDEEMEM